jgi:hypothetical protein
VFEETRSRLMDCNYMHLRLFHAEWGENNDSVAVYHLYQIGFTRKYSFTTAWYSSVGADTCNKAIEAAGPFSFPLTTQLQVEIHIMDVHNQGLPSVVLEGQTFWDIRLCSQFCISCCFGGIFSFHFQGLTSRSSKQQVWSNRPLSSGLQKQQYDNVAIQQYDNVAIQQYDNVAIQQHSRTTM